MDKDKDFHVMDLKSEEDTIITTDIDAAYIPADGGYAYVVKSGSLYYWQFADSDHKLTKVRDFSEDDSLYTTNESNTVFILSNKKDIADTYTDYGTLYRYTVGQEIQKISDKVISIKENDSQTISSDKPLIEEYVSYKNEKIYVNIATLESGKIKALVQEIER